MPNIAYRDALNEALAEEMRRDDRVFLLGEDIGLFDGAFKVTQRLLEEFGPRRVKDTPIAEEVIVGTGIGAAMVGLRPVVEIMTVNFILVAIDQIVNNAAKMRYMFGGAVEVPVVIRTPGGAGFQLGAQHSHNLEVWFAHIPGLRVVAPALPADAKGMLKAAIRDPNPVIFIEHESLYNTKGDVPEGDYVTPLDKSEYRRRGNDVTIVAHSRMTITAMAAARRLENEGIDAEVIDLRSLRPLDMAPVLESVRKTNRLVTVEEGWRAFGIGAEVAARVYEEDFDYLDAPIKRIGSAEVPMAYAKNLERAAIPSDRDIIRAVHEVLNRPDSDE
jgi:pyruvate dehydrogenase E1 component beta subunit